MLAPRTQICHQRASSTGEQVAENETCIWILTVRIYKHRRTTAHPHRQCKCDCLRVGPRSYNFVLVFWLIWLNLFNYDLVRIQFLLAHWAVSPTLFILQWGNLCSGIQCCPILITLKITSERVQSLKTQGTFIFYYLTSSGRFVYRIP